MKNHLERRNACRFTYNQNFESLHGRMFGVFKNIKLRVISPHFQLLRHLVSVYFKTSLLPVSPVSATWIAISVDFGLFSQSYFEFRLIIMICDLRETFISWAYVVFAPLCTKVIFRLSAISSVYKGGTARSRS